MSTLRIFREEETGRWFQHSLYSQYVFVSMNALCFLHLLRVFGGRNSTDNLMSFARARSYPIGHGRKVFTTPAVLAHPNVTSILLANPCMLSRRVSFHSRGSHNDANWFYAGHFTSIDTISGRSGKIISQKTCRGQTPFVDC